MKLSKSELEKREEIIKAMKDQKRSLVKRYGKDAESIMYGRATNIAKKVAENKNLNMKHNLKEMVRKALTKKLSMKENEAGSERYNKEQELKQVQDLMNELEDSLKKHDWYYMMSDSDSVYNRGSAQMDEIHELIKQLNDLGYSKEAKELFDKHKATDIY